MGVLTQPGAVFKMLQPAPHSWPYPRGDIIGLVVEYMRLDSAFVQRSVARVGLEQAAVVSREGVGKNVCVSYHACFGDVIFSSRASHSRTSLFMLNVSMWRATSAMMCRFVILL